MTWLRPLAGEVGLPLAGLGFVRFERLADGRAVADLPAADRARLSAPRAPVAGLSLERPRIMGILNVTPDSFSDGGTHLTREAAVRRAREMAAEADLLDIGGESTRPGAAEVPVAEEIQRIVPVIAAIRAAGVTTPISVDTRKAAVAEAALDAGADMVNDVSAFTFDPALADLVAERDVPVCLMHAQGLPENMQDNPAYDDVLSEVLDHLAERVAFAEARGVQRARIITDPGIGFGKTPAHNIALIRGIAAFHDLGLPVLMGASRKSLIGALSDAPNARDRLGGSLSIALHSAGQGVQFLRVHDTRETRQALDLFEAIHASPEEG